MTQTTLDKKIARLEAELKNAKASKGKEARKARTKRLIEIGGIVENVLGSPIEKDDLLKLKDFLKQQEERGQFFSKAMGKSVSLARMDEGVSSSL